MPEITGEQVNKMFPKILSVLEENLALTQEQQAILLAFMVITIGKASGASKEDLIAGFEGLVEDHYDEIQMTLLS